MRVVARWRLVVLAGADRGFLRQGELGHDRPDASVRSVDALLAAGTTLDLVGQRVHLHRAVVERDLARRRRRQASVCFIQFASSRSGKSSRACAPRLSWRASAETHRGHAPCPIRLSSSSVSIRSRVPDQRAVGDAHVVHRRQSALHLVARPRAASRWCGTPRRAPAWSSASRARIAARRLPPLALRSAVEAVERRLAGAGRQRPCATRPA